MKDLFVKNIENEGVVTMYTIQFTGEELSEYEKFVQRFKVSAELKRDYQIIIYALSKIANNGAMERYFRPEGKMNDNVCALPVDSGKLRLYCLRITDKILIIGNGGLKTTKTYEESEELLGYVMDLQKFDKLIKSEVANGSLTISETGIDGITEKNFEI
ncbi:MAG: hypothetical protein J6W30_02025 [Bacteroidales bacterium]|nr:hypothetical protein [Bacteroidales bacterium]